MAAPNDGAATKPPPHNLTSRKARARAQRTLSAIARLRFDGDGDGGDDDASGGNDGGNDSHPPPDTAIERRARAVPTVAAFCCCSSAKTTTNTIPDLPWRELPPSADPLSVLAPDHRLGARGRKKRAQVANFAAVLRRLVALLHHHQSTTRTPQRPLRIVDFGCGSGAVVLALAALFPPSEALFVGVDMKLEAIDLLHKRAAEAGFDHVKGVVVMAEDFCWGCSGSGGGDGEGDGDGNNNERTNDDDDDNPHAFDVALALHACGNATDVAIELAARSGAAFAVSPCCLGKLRFSSQGGSSFHPALRVLQSTRRGAGQRLPPLSEAIAAQEAREAASLEQRRRRGCPWVLLAEGDDDGEGGGGGGGGAGGRVRVRHPRSEWLRGQLSAGEAAADVDAAFSAIARAADGVNHGELRVVAEAAAAAGPAADGALELRAARAAKAVVEMDRAEAMREAHGYAVALLRLSPVEGEEEDQEGGDVGARDDLLLGAPGATSKAGAERWSAARDALSSLHR
jgi:SAM-dependent methyltransferase